MKLPAIAAMSLSLGLSTASASEPAPITVTRVGSQPSSAGPEQNFTGSVQASLSKGDLFGAYENFNRLTLFGFQNTVLTWLNGWLFSTSTKMGVPQQMVQNLSNALGTFLTSGTLVFGAFQSVYAPISGTAFELSRALTTVGSTLASGNVLGAVNALVNTPGTVLNAFLNGFDYSDAVNPWAGLLSPKDPNCTGRCAGGGPISQFLITIARNIANAIKVPTAAAVTTTAAAATSTDAGAASTNILSTSIEPAAQSYTLAVGKTAAAAQTGSATKAEPAATANTAAETVPAGTTAPESAAAQSDSTPAASVSESTATSSSASETSGTKAEPKDSGSTPTHPVRGESSPADSVKPAVTKPVVTKPATTKAGSAEGAAKPDSTKDTGAKADSTKGSTSADTGKSGNSKPDAVKAGGSKSGSGHADSTTGDTKHAGSGDHHAAQGKSSSGAAA